MSNPTITPADVEWPEERETYKPRHRAETGRTHAPARPSVHRISSHDERYAGRDTLDDWKARHGLAPKPEVVR